MSKHQKAPVVWFTARDQLAAIAFWVVIAALAWGTWHALKHDARVYEMAARV